MKQQVKKPSIASMLSHLGQTVATCRSTVSFKVKNRSFDYNTDQHVFMEHTSGSCKSVTTGEVYGIVESRYLTATASAA
jgi:hypothetical protein